MKFKFEGHLRSCKKCRIFFRHLKGDRICPECKEEEKAKRTQHKKVKERSIEEEKLLDKFCSRIIETGDIGRSAAAVRWESIIEKEDRWKRDGNIFRCKKAYGKNYKVPS